ncbi:unnamed protein product [Rotaria magnacalcarata]|uniref:Nuclear receptor domain-containing protein n=1 Tax=Rotaria magnacalcarata TaxID=392030 RepID=A0A817AA92_9BILA|nr:unnamed protein product [Rotaria magnacalcarata]
MANGQENDLWKMFTADDISTDSSYNISLTNNSKSTGKRPKTSLKCTVCSDDAYGYNFDVISCESCKAFFRRNALRPPGKLKCHGHGHCEVNRSTRKRCKKCRLDKCFLMGMRQEWILSEESKLKKKNKIAENRLRKQSNEFFRRRHRRISNYSRVARSSPDERTFIKITTGDVLAVMTIFDWSKIQQVQTAYSEAMAYNQVVGVPPYPATQPIHSTLELIRIPTYLSSIRLITYLRKIPEFELIDSDDRVTLVKRNLLAVVFMHIVLLYDPIADTYHEHNTQDPIFQGKDWIEILGNEFYHELTVTSRKLIQILEYDRVAVKIILLIILFTKGFCAYDIEHESSLNNPWVVHNTQILYIELLYKYCSHQYGFETTINLFSKLINQLFAIQRLSAHLKHLVHSNIDAAQLSPLMQSVLQTQNTT